MILKYSDYINEKMVYDMILESKVVYSKRFINILQKMKTNKLAANLLDIYKKDIDGITQNYIDITDTKDLISFTPDLKAKEYSDNKPELYKVVTSGKQLTHSPSNDKIFALLGYNKSENVDYWKPSTGSTGIILKEAISTSSNKIYALFQEYGVENPRLCVYNKSGLTDLDDGVIWSTSRNNIKIGRFVRALLNSLGVPFTPKEIEDFTNQYKSTFDFMSDVLKQFDIVKGKDISYWYSIDNYVSGGGSLNGSCMSEVDPDFFDIYVENKQVSLVILYSEDGNITDSKYKSDKIRGRAVLWECEVNESKGIFMDRVYTRFDSDVDLFKRFAEKNGWWYKTHQSMDPDTPITDGNQTLTNPVIKVKLDNYEFDYYPYCDTMCYLYSGASILSNSPINADMLLKDTGGGFDNLDDSWYDNDDF